MRTALSLVEAAHEVALSVPQLRRMVRRGELPCVRVGRRVLVLSEDLAAFLRTKRVPSATARPTGVSAS